MKGRFYFNGVIGKTLIAVCIIMHILLNNEEYSSGTHKTGIGRRHFRNLISIL